MTCKDCCHYDVCMDYTSLKESNFAQNFNGSDIICNHFKDKSRIVELPCAVGDKVYTYEAGRVKEWKVTFIGVNLNHEYKIFVVDDGYKNMVWNYDIGERVFLTRKEAEEALRKAVQK